jgi:hypothetical protein
MEARTAGGGERDGQARQTEQADGYGDSKTPRVNWRVVKIGLDGKSLPRTGLWKGYMRGEQKLLVPPAALRRISTHGTAGLLS